MGIDLGAGGDGRAIGATGSSPDVPEPTTRRRAILGMTAAATGALLADAALHAPAAHAEGVSSVNGKTGAVVLTAANVEAVPASELIMLPGENMAIGEGAFASFIGESKEEHEKHRGNTAYGWHAMHLLSGTHETSTEDNTAIGSQALGRLTTGGGNTAVGENAGVNITTGEENVAIGCESLATQQTATGNIAVGFRALNQNTTGSGCVAIGYSAMNENKTGLENTAVGWKAMFENTASRNTAYGFEALRNNTTGAEGVAVGRGTLTRNTTGEGNVAVGAVAMTESTTGNYNTAVGLFALGELVTGRENTAVGVAAGGECAGSGNVFLGATAGYKEKGSNRLYIANSETTEPLIFGVFPNEQLTFNATKIALYKGVTPVARHATIAVPAETLAANTKAIKEIVEAIKAIGIIL
ncbi:MAG TPA: hypothetical protein VH081_09370 [Solirubrobacteraceae bacterium]|jgi:hypothetical protein|nr:hypothetical protein [Solirubrobacteraceae bacterium]